ncbi:MAG: amidohydrolase family protein [Acidobacteria bacterium]|nr:amidohydrolase family protein [Acidobacteriota bacterium]
MKILTAGHLLPISSDPIERGAVAYDGDTIAAVGEFDEVSARFPGAEIEDAGTSVIIPGLVNCHSHLEITAMRGMLDDVENDFAAWLLRLNAIRSSLTEDRLYAAAVNGVREGIRAGVTCFGDIGRLGHIGFSALAKEGVRGIAYQETEFSPDNRTADDDFLKLTEKFEALKRDETELVKVGISPHSPYTVGSRLFELIAEYAIINRLPISIHAAESADEIDLLERGTGLFRSFFEKFELEWHSPYCSPIEYLERLGVLSARPLLAHCVMVTPTDIERIADNGAAVAHCPKSNAKFGHGVAPFKEFIDAGIATGLGSDSVASNNLCDIIEESRFAALAARVRDNGPSFVTPREALFAATLGGAAALGMDDSIGSLEEGKQADITVISLEHESLEPLGDICAALVFSASGRDVRRTIVAGRDLL